MPLQNMTKMLEHAAQKGYAVGAFNIVNELTARAVVDACAEQKAPVILQTSVSTVRKIGVRTLMGFLRPLADAASIPVAVHLDHCTDIALAKACMDAGWSSIMVDASHLPLEANIAATREVVAYVQGRDISVEGELGAIGGVEDNISVAAEDARLATVEDSITYTRETGIQAFAPAIGTAHGLYKGEPKLDFERFCAIRASVTQPLVVHGGTGLADEVFRRLVALGAAKINISTALKEAYLGGMRDFVAEQPDCGNPLKADAFIAERVADMVRRHIALFGTAGKAE